MGTIQTVLCHWAPRSLCNNTWCVTLVQATPPFLNAWTEPKEVGRRWGDLKGGWQEGCLGGSNLPSFHFSPPPPFIPHSSMPFISPAHPPFLSHSFRFYILFLPHSFVLLKISPLLFSLSLMQDFRSAVTEAEGEEGEPVLEEQRLGEILGVLPQVYTLHSSILTELEERISQWWETQQRLLLSFHFWCVAQM